MAAGSVSMSPTKKITGKNLTQKVIEKTVPVSLNPWKAVLSGTKHNEPHAGCSAPKYASLLAVQLKSTDFNADFISDAQ